MSMKMKQVWRGWLCMILLVVISVNVQAHSQDKQRVSREELAMKQAKHIAVDLGFNDDLTKKFVETYARCQKEIWEARGQVKRPKSEEVKTEEEIKQQILNSFARNRKLQDIREKYYNEFSKFLTQKQISKVYEREMVMKKHLTMKKKKTKRQH